MNRPTHPRDKPADPPVLSTDAARGGRTTGHVRQILIVSTLLAAGVLMLAWLLGAFSV